MEKDVIIFALPQKLENILRTMAIQYANKKNSLMHQLLVNSTYTVEEGTESDSWNKGIWGHTIYFETPIEIYNSIYDRLTQVQQELTSAINTVAALPDEYIERVFISPKEDDSLKTWREESGVLMKKDLSVKITAEDDLKRIWTPGFLRVFLSHNAEYKVETAELKDACLCYSIDCFVAHENIEPTMEWQSEIEKALFSMEAMILLMTDKFHESNWTDQEVGVAIGRGVPIIAIRLGRDPYGFIGKYQALPGHGKKADVLAKEIFSLFLKIPNLKDLVIEALVTRFERSRNYNEANELVKLLGQIKTMSPDVTSRLEKAPDINSQVKNAYEVKKRLPKLLAKLRSGCPG